MNPRRAGRARMPGRKVRHTILRSAIALAILVTGVSCDRRNDPALDLTAEEVAERFVGALVEGDVSTAEEFFTQPWGLDSIGMSANILHERSELSPEIDLRLADGAYVGELRGTDRSTGQPMVVPVTVELKRSDGSWVVHRFDFEFSQRFDRPSGPTPL